MLSTQGFARPWLVCELPKLLPFIYSAALLTHQQLPVFLSAPRFLSLIFSLLAAFATRLTRRLLPPVSQTLP